MGLLGKWRIAFIVLISVATMGCSTTRSSPTPTATPNGDTTERLLRFATVTGQLYAANQLQMISGHDGSACDLTITEEPNLRNLVTNEETFELDYNGTIEYTFEISCGPTDKWSRYSAKLSCTYLIGDQYIFLDGTRYWKSDSSKLSLGITERPVTNGQLYELQPCPASE
jgi:hypothetical protein